MGMEKWWGPVSSCTGMCEEAWPPSPCSIFTPSFLPSFLSPPTALITSGLRRTTVQCQEQPRQEGGYWFWRQKGQWAWSPQVLAGSVLQSQMPPLLLSSLALPLTLHPRLQRDSHRPGLSLGRCISTPPQGWPLLMFTSVRESLVLRLLPGEEAPSWAPCALYLGSALPHQQLSKHLFLQGNLHKKYHLAFQ